MQNIDNFLNYYLTHNIVKLIDKVHNTKKLGPYLYTNLLSKRNFQQNIICKDYTFLTNYNYNKSIEIDEINQYTVLNINIDLSESLKIMAKTVLKNILKSKKILINNEPVHFKDCVIVDIINTSDVTLTGIHTDIEYSYFTGNSFNVWYLIENNKNYGNMFMLETDEYKKIYTPCKVINFDYDKKNNKINSIDLHNHSMVSIVKKKVGTINNFKVTYTNINNGDCLVMSKHVLHTGDNRRNNNVKGFHFRVLVKNDDGSIDYNKYYTSNKFSNHRWDKNNKKLFGVELFDFALER
jgi:hypothetical protein